MVVAGRGKRAAGALPGAERFAGDGCLNSSVLELDLHPDDAGRIGRLPSLARLRAGRTISTARRLVWHDTPDDALARAGLALCAQQNDWQLERLLPDERPWPPATSAPILGSGPDPATLSRDLPDLLPQSTLSGLVPLAVFEGRERVIPLADGATELTLSVLEGRLRAVTDEQRSCVLRLSGPPAQLASLAEMIGAELRLSVPRSTLAGAARALARGTDIPPRRLGAPVLSPDMKVGDAFAHVAGHLVDAMLHWAALAPRGQSAEPVHQMRVAVRRLRSALSVFRPAIGCPETEAASAALRMLGGQLSSARDWDVFLAGTGAAVRDALPDHPRIKAMLAAASRQRLSAYQALAEQLGNSAFRQLSVQLAALAALRPWEAQAEPARTDLLAEDCAAFAARALSRRLRRVLKAGRDIDGLATAELHELRKDAKRLRYASEFFAPLFSARAGRRFIKRLAKLQNELGLLNDGAVATGLMAALGPEMQRGFAAGVVQGFVAARAARARTRIGRAWERLRQQDPFWD